MTRCYDELRQRLREVAALRSVLNLVSWDQETMMPAKGGDFRAEELALLGRMAHERATDPRVEQLLAACEADATLAQSEATQANLRELRRDLDRASRLSPELVAEINETSSRGLEAWKQARHDNDFALFEPWLEKQMTLARRKAECYGAPEGGELYDALVQDFEPDMTGAELEQIFAPLRVELTALIEQLRASEVNPDDRVNGIEVPLQRQQELNEWILRKLGFDMSAGRIDLSTHPFSTGVAPGDTRITTRYADARFTDALSSTLHEAGHGMYEQGLPKQTQLGLPAAEPWGLGLHESQSRMWENHVGRSRAFWEWALPHVKRIFGQQFNDFQPDDLYRAINRVEPGLIRVDSDEATYNLHIMLRFDLERAMIRGDLAVADLPGAWNERMARDLGLTVPDNARGCLQDVHWSMGHIGYFPTYTLGNLYAAQFWESIGRAIPDLDARMRRGEFDRLLSWLRENVHAHGRRYSARDLCLKLTGEPLGHGPLLRHLTGRLNQIYRLDRSRPVSAD